MSSGYKEAAIQDTEDPETNVNSDSSVDMEKVQWIVRPAQLRDKDKVDALLKTSYGTLLPANYSPEILTKALPKICIAQETLLTCGTWYVVEDPQTGTLVGCGGYTTYAPGPFAGQDGAGGVDDTIQAPHLRHFAVDPTYARKGVATAIWNHSWNTIVEHYQIQGQPAPAMEVISSLTAESFYTSLGFEKVESLTVPLGGDCDFPATLMRRPEPTPKVVGNTYTSFFGERKV
jgi:GNAT superfamily N-acetyltransferase